MDWVCESILRLLRTKGKKDGMGIRQLVDESGFARQTAHNHLRHLTASGQVVKKPLKRGLGRPEILYRVSRQAFRMPDGGVMVSLPFKSLRRVSRFEKGGWCKEVRGTCGPESCTLILKNE